MALPGFTAEESLYKTNGQYQVTRGRMQADGTVYPAQSNRTTCSTYDVTVTDCCSPEPSLSDCWKCTRTDPYGLVYRTWYEGTCQEIPQPPKPPTTRPPEPPTRGGGHTGPTGPRRTCLLNGIPTPCEEVHQCVDQGICEVIYKKA
jgi:hypothetical protein